MQCPDCGGAMWDNRETKKSPKQPDYKCKNKQCDKAVWLEKRGDSTGHSAPSNANGHAAVAEPARGAAIGAIYAECFEFANKAVTHYLGERATPESIVAATATLFIEACRSNRPIRAAKPVPPPPPPPPPVHHDHYDDSRDLPF